MVQKRCKSTGGAVKCIRCHKFVQVQNEYGENGRNILYIIKHVEYMGVVRAKT